MLTGSVMFKIGACWTVATQSICLPIDAVRMVKDTIVNYRKNRNYFDFYKFETLTLRKHCNFGPWCHSQICLHLHCNSIIHACQVYLFRYVCLKGIWSVTNPSLCLHVGCRSHRFEKFVGYDLGGHLEYVKCWVIASLESQGWCL